MRKYKFGWHGDNGLGEQLIQAILAGRKTACVCPAYDPADSDVREGEELALSDKHGSERGVIRVTAIEARTFSELDDVLAAQCGTTLEELISLLHYANSRKIRPDEEMRITRFELLSAIPAKVR